MISNSTSYKLKASRSSREINDFENNDSDEVYETSPIDGDLDNNSKYSTYTRDTQFRGDGRARTADFRSNPERRGYRTRGGSASTSSRRSDREGPDFYILNRNKYQDSLIRHSDSTNSHGKFYENDKKSEVKLPEDTRISKLLRRLSTETVQKKSLAICKKLLEVLLLPDNAIYVRKAFHILGESMYDILRVSPGPLAKHQATRALGRMGYIMGQENDFERYQTWVFLKIKNTDVEETKILLMKSFKETLALEKNRPMLQDYARSLIHNLVISIEVTENADFFKVILDVLMTTVEIYPDCFYNQFQDTVDLLFGWHVDHTQPLENIEFISRNLQRASEHFRFNQKFSVSLIENFFEDITNYNNQLSKNENNAFEHVAVLVLALNTVLKCLGEHFCPQDNKYVTFNLVTTCLNEVIKMSKDVLENYLNDNIIIATNESVAILLSNLDSKSQALSQSIYDLIDLEISLVTAFSDATIVSLLLLISKIIKELSANLPIELIEKLIGPEAEIRKLRNSHFVMIRDGVICVYQALLNLKNVSLLQEAYRYVLGDLEANYQSIVPALVPFITNNPFGEQNTNVELTVLFLLRCLSQLANASSIIVMWALKPSILELIGVNLQPFDLNLAKKQPVLQYSLLYLLHSHCKCYNHFISSSNLVVKKQDQNNLIGLFTMSDGLNLNDVPNTSPNLGNFEIILNILYKTLSQLTSDEVTILLLQWLHDILLKSDSYLVNLYENEQFAGIVEVLVKVGYNYNKQIAISVCQNLSRLLSNKQIAWSQSFLVVVCDLCKLQMSSTDQQIRAQFSKLILQIPWDITIVELNKSNSNFNRKKKTSKAYNNYTVWQIQHHHLNHTTGDIFPQQFKVFMEYLLNNKDLDANWLEDIFIASGSSHCLNLDKNLILASQIVLNNWTALESAQFCVNNKLRTPLGKATDTFTKIEGALNQLGNALINVEKGKVDANRVRLLLQFVDNLEKAIYNASEGCAIAMQQPPKLVRSFFITNTRTCTEWLSRLRMVVIHVALHAGDLSTAIRHGFCFLTDLMQGGRCDGVEFERGVIFVTLALLQMRESEAIWGLYVWCKNSAGRKFYWTKYAAEQAYRRYETALDGYSKLIEDNKDLECDTRTFIEDQIVICYKELGNLSGLTNWSQSTLLKTQLKGYWFNVTDWSTITNLFNIKINDQAMLEFASWNYKTEPDSWSQYHLLTMTETNLYEIAYNINDEELQQKIETNQSLVETSICENLNWAPGEFLQTALIVKYTLANLNNIITNLNPSFLTLVSEGFDSQIEKIDSSVLRKVLFWSDYFDSQTTFTERLRLDVMKRARKETNYNLAFTQVSEFLINKQLITNENGFSNLANIFLQQIGEIAVWDVNAARATNEIIKLCYAVDQVRQPIFNFCASAAKILKKQADMYQNIELKKISSKILLKLAKWLQAHEEINFNEFNSPLVRHLMVLPEIKKIESVSHIIPIREMAIGKLLQSTVNQCNDLAKGWNAFGTWCYCWGRKIVDQNSDEKSFTAEDYALIKQIVPANISEEDLSKIYMILSQTRPNLVEEDIESQDTHTSDMIRTQLRYITCLQNTSEANLIRLVQVWQNIQKRIYTCYELSAEAYFKYLHLSMHSVNITRSTACNVITVTLRLLRLIAKYALELQNILEEGLATTPTPPWKVIIPQLFSRLNHPESYVRHRVSDLLCRIAEDAPHLITFPAVVGALEGGVKFDFSEISLPKDCLSQNKESQDELNEEDDNYDSDNEDSSNALQLCFKTMVDTLSKQDPETISQVQNLVKELRRITLLWDELWLGTLAQHQTEITKRQQQLEYEIEKVNENLNLDPDEKQSLIAEKHRIIIKPIIFVLEQLKEVTSVEAETPHEKDFQAKYLKEIATVISKLKNPESPEKPQESLQPLKSLQKQFQQKFHRRAAYTLKMTSISPVLASIKNTLIAMPGITTTSKLRTSISHISNDVSILPTKTKPKKLIFYGSDGHSYTYLFKGLEDLHLDERIMQFLSIANTMMAQNSDLTERNLYRARHYSVIPLGPRSGLISWVDGTTPAFALYKRWQQRELAKPTTKNSFNTTTTILRPSELFYNKLNPLLKEHGVKNIENRKEWPLSVLKQVLSELMTETPRDLLAKELWCNSISASEWWQVVKRYSYSMAVMSIIGYIIGLGDRHLDNILVDLTSGEIVHIDYNVCFEKGKTLRVPEKVPFRLTPNIQGALGVTGVEGIFRMTCESVLKTMRMGRETLLTLLEAFVYDPLIDWTVGGEVLAGTSFGGITSTASSSRQSKKDLEKEVTLSMFSVRCTELKFEWEENKTDIMTTITTLSQCLTAWQNTQKKVAETEDYLQDLHQQMALVKEAEAHGANKHNLYNLPSRHEVYRKTQEAMNTARKDLDKIIEDSTKHIQLYSESTRLLDNAQFAQMIARLKNLIVSINIFPLLKDFLLNAGKNDVILQCEQSGNEIEEFSKLQKTSIFRCLQLLEQYNGILSQCPKSYIENHCMYLYAKWSKFLLQTKTVEGCKIIYEKYESFRQYGTNNQNLKFVYALQEFYNDTGAQVDNLYTEFNNLANDSVTSLENAKRTLTKFCLEKGTAAFEFVLANELLLLNKNFLQLETAASRSGDLLIKLTSRDGDWFLDELVMNSKRVVEMIENIPKSQVENLKLARIFSGIKIANNVYQGLYDLHYNFYTIILPETMKKIQSEDESVITMFRELANLISPLEVSIPSMILQLEKLLSSLFMQMDINATYNQILDRVTTIKKQYKFLVKSSQTHNLSQGEMLLMGFNGLFDKLDQEMTTLVSVLGNLDIPTSWKRLDQVKEAKSISAHIFNPKVHEILENIFFLKRLQTMSEFFTLTYDMCQSFQPNGKCIIYTDEQLNNPVRQFIADFIARQLLGITTEAVAYTICFLLQNLGVDVIHEIEQKDIGAESKVPLDDLCQKTWNLLLKQGTFNQSLLSQASGFSASLKTAWEKLQEPKKIQQKLNMLQSSNLRLHNQITVYNFMYEELSPQLQMRSNFLLELQGELVALKGFIDKLREARVKENNLIENVLQRLNWAKGANPDVGEILSVFENALMTREKQFELESTVGGEILIACNSILQHEFLRTKRPESKEYDNMFFNSFEKWQFACQYSNSKDEIMTPTEESIMNLLTPNLLQNPKWLQAISEIISDLIKKTQQIVVKEKANLFVLTDEIEITIEAFREVYNIHCRLMGDVKLLIKSMTKIDEYSVQTQQFIADYRQYFEHFTNLFIKVKMESPEEVAACFVCINYLEVHTNRIYEDLMNLELRQKRPVLMRQSCIALQAIRLKNCKQESMTKGQQRNAYAVNVWRRVKMKLEGRDPDPGRKYTSPEQVDYVIREATNLDNLALLYEGWTPWV